MPHIENLKIEQQGSQLRLSGFRMEGFRGQNLVEIAKSGPFSHPGNKNRAENPAVIYRGPEALRSGR